LYDSDEVKKIKALIKYLLNYESKIEFGGKKTKIENIENILDRTNLFS